MAAKKVHWVSHVPGNREGWDELCSFIPQKSKFTQIGVQEKWW